MYCVAACAFEPVKQLHLPAPVGDLREEPRHGYIDALRGIAALLVVWLHVTQNFLRISPSQPMPGRWLADVAQDFDVGRVGVVLFFLISGYVIPGSIRLDLPAPIGTFVIRRLLRIYPAYWLSIPLCAFATWRLWHLPFGAREFLVNLTLLQDLFGIDSASGTYWTLLVELVFYVLCIILVLAGSLQKPFRIATIAVVFAALHSAAAYALWLGAPLNRLAAFMPVHLSFMLCGTLFRYRHDGRLTSEAARALFNGLIAYYLMVFPVGAIWARGPFNNYVVSSALGLLIFIAGTMFVRLRSRAMQWLGAISYSIYLFHVVVLFVGLWWLLRQPEGSIWRVQHMAVYLIACTLITILIAALVHRFVEQPGIRFGRRCAEIWQRRTQRRRTAALEP